MFFNVVLLKGILGMIEPRLGCNICKRKNEMSRENNEFYFKRLKFVSNLPWTFLPLNS